MNVGEQIGRLTLVAPCYKGRHRAWECRCSCGQTHITRESSLRDGYTRSCGCWQKEIARERIAKRHGELATNYRHGELVDGRMTPECKAFYHAKARCSNPNTPFWYRYGGRGIQFRFPDFLTFLTELGRRPGAGYSLDRINNDGHYEPGNVRWADAHTQAMNKSRGRWKTSTNS